MLEICMDLELCPYSLSDLGCVFTRFSHIVREL